MPTLNPPIATGRTAEVFEWEDQTILKLYRKEFPTSWVDYEASIGRQVCAAGIRAPAVHEIVEIDGRRGIVYERIRGISMLEELARKPWKLFSLARQLAEVHIEMHSQPLPQLSPFREQLQRAIVHAEDLPAELKGPILQVLADLPNGDRLCHGDFHPGNVIVTEMGLVTIDWMTAAAGNPWADVARTCMLLNDSDVPKDTPARGMILFARRLFYRGYLNHYLDHISQDRKQLLTWMPVIAAARLNENILPERERMIEIVRSGLAEMNPQA